MSEVVLLRAKKEPHDNYEQVLSQVGYNVQYIPVLEFKFISQYDLEVCLKQSHQFGGLVFTSQTSVQSIVAQVNNIEIFKESWSHLPVFVVGQATEECVRTQLGLDRVLGSSGNVELLSDVIIKSRSLNDKPLLFPCGNLHKETLPQRLHEAGIGLHSLTCYETCPHSQLDTNIRTLNWKDGTNVVFFSPSGVQFAFPIIQSTVHDIHSLNYCAIGPSTAEALSAVGISPVVAKKPTPQEVLAILQTIKQ